MNFVNKRTILLILEMAFTLLKTTISVIYALREIPPVVDQIFEICTISGENKFYNVAQHICLHELYEPLSEYC